MYPIFNAHVDKDFNSTQFEDVFEPGANTVDQHFTISVVDDDVHENEELFVVRLGISDATDESELEVGIQFLLIRISPDGRDGEIFCTISYNYIFKVCMKLKVIPEKYKMQ